MIRLFLYSIALIEYKKSKVNTKYWNEFRFNLTLDISHSLETVVGLSKSFRTLAPNQSSDLFVAIILLGRIIFQKSHIYEKNMLKQLFLLLVLKNHALSPHAFS